MSGACGPRGAWLGWLLVVLLSGLAGGLIGYRAREAAPVPTPESPEEEERAGLDSAKAPRADDRPARLATQTPSGLAGFFPGTGLEMLQRRPSTDDWVLHSNREYRRGSVALKVNLPQALEQAGYAPRRKD